MSYFVKQIKKNSKHEIILIEPPQKLINIHYYLSRIWQLSVALYLKQVLCENDIVFFIEYLGGWRAGGHSIIASTLKKWNIKNHLCGLVHLAKSHLLESYNEKNIVLELNNIDYIIVMGSSLEKDIIQLGFEGKILTTFYYVDTKFYHPLKTESNKRLKAIAIGNLKRNHHAIANIAKNCPEIDFIVCSGKSNLDYLTTENVSVLGYMEEKEMLMHMQNADISLSIMEDTVGSNVIVTSLACGLINVVSDVGSIRDYCSEKNSVFCTTEQDFISALKALSTDHELTKKKENARERALEISLDKSVSWYDNFFEKINNI